MNNSNRLVEKCDSINGAVERVRLSGLVAQHVVVHCAPAHSTPSSAPTARRMRVNHDQHYRHLYAIRTSVNLLYHLWNVYVSLSSECRPTGQFRLQIRFCKCGCVTVIQSNEKLLYLQQKKLGLISPFCPFTCNQPDTVDAVSGYYLNMLIKSQCSLTVSQFNAIKTNVVTIRGQ